MLNISENRSGEDLARYEHFYTTAQWVTGLICYPIICVFGILGNVFILVIFGKKSLHSSTNIYLSALAVSDLLKLLNDSLYFLTVLLTYTVPSAGNKAFGYLYPYAHFIFNMSVCVSSWLTVSVAVERYILVCHPARAKVLISIARAQLLSGLCFLVMTLLAIPSALRYRTVTEWFPGEDGANVTQLDVELTDLWRNQQFVLTYNWIQSLLRSIIPLFILLVLNGFIINALRQTRANKKMAQRNRITTMLIVVILFFLFCIIPDAVMSAFFNLGYTESKNFLVKGIREITDMLLAVNAASNFFVYFVFNSIFRQHLLTLCCARCADPDTAQKSQETQYKRLEVVNTQAANHCETSQTKL